MPEVVDIAEESKKYQDEWVLFVVKEVDELNQPVRGHFLGHNKSRDEIHEVAMKHRGEGLGLQFIFTGDPAPPDTVVIL